MADLDVSDVLDDPDFQSTFTILRATATVDGTGTNIVTTAPPAIVAGVVQPANMQDLQRLPDASRQSGSIKLYTRFAMNLDVAEVLANDGTVATPGTQADEVVWNGSTYTVMTCNPWLYGSGYYESLAALTTLS